MKSADNLFDKHRDAIGDILLKNFEDTFKSICCEIYMADWGGFEPPTP